MRGIRYFRREPAAKDEIAIFMASFARIHIHRKKGQTQDVLCSMKPTINHVVTVISCTLKIDFRERKANYLTGATVHSGSE